MPCPEGAICNDISTHDYINTMEVKPDYWVVQAKFTMAANWSQMLSSSSFSLNPKASAHGQAIFQKCPYALSCNLEIDTHIRTGAVTP